MSGRQKVKARKDKARCQREATAAFSARTGCELVDEDDYMATHNTTNAIRRQNISLRALAELGDKPWR